METTPESHQDTRSTDKSRGPHASIWTASRISGPKHDTTYFQPDGRDTSSRTPTWKGNCTNGGRPLDTPRNRWLSWNQTPTPPSNAETTPQSTRLVIRSLVTHIHLGRCGNGTNSQQRDTANQASLKDSFTHQCAMEKTTKTALCQHVPNTCEKRHELGTREPRDGQRPMGPDRTASIGENNKENLDLLRPR